MGRKIIGGKNLVGKGNGDNSDGTSQEVEPSSSKPFSDNVSTRGNNKGYYGWTSYDLVSSVERKFRSRIGREVTLRVELRVPEGRTFLRYAFGRVDPKSPIGLSRHGFFEDIPHAIEALLEAYQIGAATYFDLESNRMRRNVSRDLDNMERAVSTDVSGWKADVQRIRDEMFGRLP